MDAKETRRSSTVFMDGETPLPIIDLREPSNQRVPIQPLAAGTTMELGRGSGRAERGEKRNRRRRDVRVQRAGSTVRPNASIAFAMELANSSGAEENRRAFEPPK